MRSYDIPPELLELGYPTDLPDFPAPPESLIRPQEFPSESHRVLFDWLCGPGLEILLEGRAPWAVGISEDKNGNPEALFLIDAESKDDHALPEEIISEGHSFRVGTRECPRRLVPTQGPGNFARRSGTRGGVAVTNDPQDFGGAGGTYTGTFDKRGGGGLRGVTNAHVAVGFGFLDFLANPLGILAWFRSPRGETIYASSGPQVGQGRFELFRVETPWPVLTYIPLALPPPALAFLYLDVAAGDIRLRHAPQARNFLPPGIPLPAVNEKELVTGVRAGSGRAFIGGEVYGIGAELGLRWGRSLAQFLIFPLPVPIPGLPVIVIFNLNLYELDISPGDSGMLVLELQGDHPNGLAGLGLGGSPANPINNLTLATPLQLVELFGEVHI